MTLVQPFIDKFKHAKVKARIGVFAQSTPMHELGGEFDESLEMILLQPNLNLTLDVVHEEGVLATYTIYELEKSGVLKE